MQPEQARRGTAFVAGTTLAFGVVLVVLALVLSACGGSSRTASSTSPSSSSSTSASPSSSGSQAASSSAAVSSSSAPSSAPATGAPSGSVASGSGTGGLPTQAAVPIASAATFTAGVTSTVITIAPIDATAALPGEISGPAVRLTLAIQNASTTSVDLGNVIVDLQDAAGVSATSLSGNGSAPFSGTLAPGSSASGTYVFTVAQDDRTGMKLFVTCNAALPVVVFTGDLP